MLRVPWGGGGGHDFLAEDAVDYRGLAHVGITDQSNRQNVLPHAALLSLRLRLPLRLRLRLLVEVACSEHPRVLALLVLGLSSSLPARVLLGLGVLPPDSALLDRSQQRLHRVLSHAVGAGLGHPELYHAQRGVPRAQVIFPGVGHRRVDEIALVDAQHCRLAEVLGGVLEDGLAEVEEGDAGVEDEDCNVRALERAPQLPPNLEVMLKEVEALARVSLVYGLEPELKGSLLREFQLLGAHRLVPPRPLRNVDHRDIASFNWDGVGEGARAQRALLFQQS
mmetsp:Transcript_58522/g.137784  ORF Transcript_58522/g.137784 Transcript_58522/m.137784 type:complete len:280 (+) Transcript_58522:883-1722(+)